jgi:hypothetical protein
MLSRKELFHRNLPNEERNQANNSGNNENNTDSAGYRHSSSGNSNNSVSVLKPLTVLETSKDSSPVIH